MHINKLLVFIIVVVVLIVSFSYFRYNTAEITILQNRIEELETENQAIKEYYTAQYELRNKLDLMARKIYAAMNEKDLDTIKNAVTSSTEVLEDKLIFKEDNKEFIFDFSHISEAPTVLRQRYYELSPNRKTFETGYEIILKDAEYIPVITMIFTEEKGEWKLSSILSQ
ncbi:hypothetical protein F8154_01145 [Alkaliphilus pronyensis]|uniref:DUF4829 domain-containing protein n=1 Tax=Alkaliphilus pronyensis TaxID=1482732 RepID=A0A6I0FIX8_9FIRM|nr:hypothetical protein [Alkaliphilus pronyensis]KAB3539067.1 hypothetical protein F8154_01145 [Alkaliphilus pronyensis]